MKTLSRRSAPSSLVEAPPPRFSGLFQLGGVGLRTHGLANGHQSIQSHLRLDVDAANPDLSRAHSDLAIARAVGKMSFGLAARRAVQRVFDGRQVVRKKTPLSVARIVEGKADDSTR